MKKICISAAALLLCAAAMAQNINPTVEVTNTYQGDPSAIQKPQQKMNVPDSLLRFDMNYDYQVFEKPYQGAYKFKPYQLNMSPDKDAYRGRSIYLKAGAGYSFHPQLDFVFSPEQRGPFQMSVYATHKSYFGKYNGFRSNYDVDHFMYDKTLEPYKGYDALTTAGFEGRYNWDKTIASFRLGYYGLMAKDTISKRMYNGFDFNARVHSNNSESSYFYYDASLEGRIGNDRLDYSVSPLSLTFDKGNIREGRFRLKGDFGPQLNYYQRILVGIDAETASYGGDFFVADAGRIALIPKYEFEMGRWDVSVGARIERLTHGSQGDTTIFKPMYTKKGKLLYPEVHVGFTASDNVLMYANITGGSDLNAYCRQISDNHFFSPSYGYERPLLDYSVVKYNLQAGVKGNLWTKLQFDVNGGVAEVENGLADDAYLASAVPAVSYQDYSLIYANILLGLKVGNFDFDASARIRNQQFVEDRVSAFRLPKFTGNFRAVYHFGQRVYFGTMVEVASKRIGKFVMPGYSVAEPVNAYTTLYPSYDGSPVIIPGYVDLGLMAGWQLGRRLGLWAEAGNLLCDNVQRNLFHVEKDLWITAGITLNL